MSTYSFNDVVATIDGPGGSVNLASDAGAAEEGISIEPVNDLSSMTIGAGGDGQHNMSADSSVTVTVRLLKTSPVNAQLMNMLNQQQLSSASHGRNVITVRDVARGDQIVCEKAAFARRPSLSFGKEGGTNEWTFNAISSNTILGVGSPEL